MTRVATTIEHKPAAYVDPALNALTVVDSIGDAILRAFERMDRVDEITAEMETLTDGLKEEKILAGAAMASVFARVMREAGDPVVEGDGFWHWYQYSRKAAWDEELRKVGKTRDQATRGLQWHFHPEAAQARREADTGRGSGQQRADTQQKNRGGTSHHDSDDGDEKPQSFATKVEAAQKAAVAQITKRTLVAAHVELGKHLVRVRTGNYAEVLTAMQKLIELAKELS